MQEKQTMINPLVSIIMPCYNRASIIQESITSVIHQTFKNWELIIVDDGSSDNSVDIILQFLEDHRIVFIQRKHEIKGASSCRNIGLRKASGKYIVYLDSDDLLTQNCLQNRLNEFDKNQDFDFLVFPTLLFNKEVYDLNILWNIDKNENDLERFLRVDALWQTTGPIYKKESLIKLNGFDENLEFWQDFDLHIRLLINDFTYKKFLFYQPDNFHRVHKNSISRSISYVNDEDILDKRINFLFNIYIKLNSASHKNCRKVLKFVIYEFVNFYLENFSNFEKFKHQTNRFENTMNINKILLKLNIFYSKLFYKRDKTIINKITLKILRICGRYFLFNKSILNNSTLFKVYCKKVNLT
jgi:glycosyltransferase involved in cell wall biosynthesis